MANSKHACAKSTHTPHKKRGLASYAPMSKTTQLRLNCWFITWRSAARFGATSPHTTQDKRGLVPHGPMSKITHTRRYSFDHLLFRATKVRKGFSSEPLSPKNPTFKVQDILCAQERRSQKSPPGLVKVLLVHSRTRMTPPVFHYNSYDFMRSPRSKLMVKNYFCGRASLNKRTSVQKSTSDSALTSSRGSGHRTCGKLTS